MSIRGPNKTKYLCCPLLVHLCDTSSPIQPEVTGPFPVLPIKWRRSELRRKQLYVAMSVRSEPNPSLRRTAEAAALITRELAQRGHTVLRVDRGTLHVRSPGGDLYLARVRSLSTRQSDWPLRTSTSRRADVWLLVSFVTGCLSVLPGHDAERAMIEQNRRLGRRDDYMPQGVSAQQAAKFERRWDLLPG